uniref:Uncharacterized protein n=1 Tax=Tanacetum cinerariifolium TaxID=118510 RepID=A0A6L2LAY2_TANCI|nr:hypothetical protein [Tanacetum cinerariifolium]
MASLMFFGSVRLTDFQSLVLTDDLSSNDVQKGVVDRMYAYLTNQHDEMMDPINLVPVGRDSWCLSWILTCSIMGEPLSSDRMFNLPVDEPEPHPTYFLHEPMVGPIVDEIAEPIVEAEEQVIAPVVDVDEDIAMLFGDDDLRMMTSRDSMRRMFESTWNSYTSIGDRGLEYRHGKPTVRTQTTCKEGDSVSDAEVAVGISIGEIGTRVFSVEGLGQQTTTQRDEVIAGLTQQVQALQVAVQQRDSQIQQLQTMVSEMSSQDGQTSH